MKEYLNIRNYFIGKVNVDNDGNLSDDKYHRGSLGDFDEKYFEVISHAINSHDELVQMNKELLAALEAAVECKMVPISSANEGGAARHSIQVQVADQIRSVIAKAKGGAA